MSDAKYILGTDEYVVWKIECTALGFTYVSGDWTAKAGMALQGTAFVDQESSFTTAALSTVGGEFFGKAKLTDLGGTVAGQYRILTRLTKTAGGVEIPLIEAAGRVIVRAP